MNKTRNAGRNSSSGSIRQTTSGNVSPAATRDEQIPPPVIDAEALRRICGAVGAIQRRNRKALSIYKLYRIVDTVDTELAGETYQRYLDREANAAKIAELENGHRQNSHSEEAAQASGDPK